MNKWVTLTLIWTGEPIYINSFAITAITQESSNCGARVYTVESNDAWEVTETAKEVIEKIQEVDNVWLRQSSKGTGVHKKR